MRLPASLAVLVAGLAQAQAQYLINELSFGYGNRYGYARPVLGHRVGCCDD